MTRIPTVLCAALLAVAATASCGGDPSARSTSQGDDGAWIELALAAGGQPARLPVSVSGIVVERASFFVRDMRLVADHGRDDDQLRVSERLVELQDGGWRVHLPDAPPGLYSRLRARIERPDHDDDRGDDRGDRSRRASFSITGRTPEGTPFALTGEDDFELDLRAGDGAELAPGMSLTATVLLDVGQWWTGVQPSAATGGDKAEELLERLAKNIAKSATLTLRDGTAAQ